MIATSAKEEESAIQFISDAKGAIPEKLITTKRAGRIAREVVADEKRQNIPVIPEPHILGADLRIGDFREKLTDIPPNSVSLICTDPPYNKNDIQLWKDLAIFAKRVLKPGGWLATYSGQSHLDQVISLLASELTYVWIIAQINTASAKNLIHHAHIYSCWKPILLFCKPPLSPITWANDLINGGGKDKNLHDWQQAISEAVYCIESFSTEGSLVVDPFVGSGTTAEAAKQTKRMFIGCDLDAANISNAIERLKQCKQEA